MAVTCKNLNFSEVQCTQSTPWASLTNLAVELGRQSFFYFRTSLFETTSPQKILNSCYRKILARSPRHHPNSIYIKLQVIEKFEMLMLKMVHSRQKSLDELLRPLKSKDKP